MANSQTKSLRQERPWRCNCTSYNRFSPSNSNKRTRMWRTTGSNIHSSLYHLISSPKSRIRRHFCQRPRPCSKISPHSRHVQSPTNGLSSSNNYKISHRARQWGECSSSRGSSTIRQGQNSRLTSNSLLPSNCPCKIAVRSRTTKSSSVRARVDPETWA